MLYATTDPLALKNAIAAFQKMYPGGAYTVATVTTVCNRPAWILTTNPKPTAALPAVICWHASGFGILPDGNYPLNLGPGPAYLSDLLPPSMFAATIVPPGVSPYYAPYGGTWQLHFAGNVYTLAAGGPGGVYDWAQGINHNLQSVQPNPCP